MFFFPGHLKYKRESSIFVIVPLKNKRLNSKLSLPHDNIFYINIYYSHNLLIKKNQTKKKIRDRIKIFHSQLY